MPDRRVGLRGALADADDVVLADEDAGLAEYDLALLERCRAQHHEQRIAVDLELGHLVRGERILDCQLVQPELRLQMRRSCSVGSWKPIQTAGFAEYHLAMIQLRGAQHHEENGRRP